MKIKFPINLLAFLLLALLTITSCSESDDPKPNDPENPDNGGDQDEDTEEETLVIDDLYLVESDIVWTKNTKVELNASVWVKEGAVLTIEEGVYVQIDKDSDVEFFVEGDMLMLGSEDARVTFTVADEHRIDANIYKGLWKGFMLTETCNNFVADYTTFEFCGAIADDESLAVQAGLADDGEPFVGIYCNNNTANVIIHNSEILYFADDAIYTRGAKLSVYKSTFAFVGETGGEALNMKTGTTGDVCYNLFYHCATNGPKVGNSKASDIQANVKVYNNTIVNGGWRRSKAGRGGSINIESGARGTIVNNLVVNCKYGLRIVGNEDGVGTDVDLTNSRIDHQYYYGNNQKMMDEFYPSNGYIPGDDEDFFKNDVLAESTTAGMPMFVSFDSQNVFSISNPDSEFPIPNETAELDQFRQYDFHLKSSSPVLDNGTSDVSATYSSITVAGKTFSVENSESFIGAFGIN